MRIVPSVATPKSPSCPHRPPRQEPDDESDDDVDGDDHVGFLDVIRVHGLEDLRAASARASRDADDPK